MVIKPRLYTDTDAWESAGRRGFLLDSTADGPVRADGAAVKDIGLLAKLVEKESWLKSCLDAG